jgi:hypothetical protein
VLPAGHAGCIGDIVGLKTNCKMPQFAPSAVMQYRLD